MMDWWMNGCSHPLLDSFDVSYYYCCYKFLLLDHVTLTLSIFNYADKFCFSFYSREQNFRGHVDAYHVNAVDTTGAGDSYVGALLCKIVDDHSLIEVTKTSIFAR